MDFAVLCVLQAINGLVGWYEESNSSDAIKALQYETQWPWIVALSREVELGVRELVKIISTIANTNNVGHFEIIIYSITLFLFAVSFIFVCFIMACSSYTTEQQETARAVLSIGPPSRTLGGAPKRASQTSTLIEPTRRDPWWAPGRATRLSSLVT